MPQPIRIFGISGSLRRDSFNTRVLRTALELAPAGMAIDIGSLAHSPPVNPIRELPLFDDDMRAAGIPAAVRALADRCAAADGVLIASPEYNFTIPGALKNAFDWMSRIQPSPLAGKPLAMMGAARGQVGTARMQYHLRQMAVFLDMHPLNKPEVMITFSEQKFDATGRLADEATRGVIKSQLEAFAAWCLRLKAPAAERH